MAMYLNIAIWYLNHCTTWQTVLQCPVQFSTVAYHAEGPYNHNNRGVPPAHPVCVAGRHPCFGSRFATVPVHAVLPLYTMLNMQHALQTGSDFEWR